MTILQSIILGIVQGLTELLPISSSAHLYIIPTILKWNIPDSFDVALHFGTLMAIAIFFFKDWIKLITAGYKQIAKKEKTAEGRMFWYLVAATIPGGILGLICDKFFDFQNFYIVGIALIIMGILLYFADKKCKSTIKYENMNFKQTFLIGLSQALAFIPGVSRSGVTMTAGRLMGVERESVARYSFMLSAPIVLGATLYKAIDFVGSIDLAFICGVIASFLIGIAVIKFLLEYLKKGSFKAFAIYRVILGVFVIAYAIFYL